MSRVKDKYWNEMMDNSESAIELRHWEEHMARCLPTSVL